LLRNAIRILRAMKREEHIDLVWFGGARSGTDAAKLIGMGAKAIAYGVPVALALGGQITGDHAIEFEADRSDEDRTHAVENILKAHAGEASMMARCTGKTNLMNLEPEDLRAISIATSKSTGIPLVGKH
jgi:isopentenyl diphosphate isomerase/L-lactate dehydrogenase-like FMN-dependent dehydrogenase